MTHENRFSHSFIKLKTVTEDNKQVENQSESVLINLNFLIVLKTLPCIGMYVMFLYILIIILLVLS